MEAAPINTKQALPPESRPQQVKASVVREGYSLGWRLLLCGLYVALAGVVDSVITHWWYWLLLLGAVVYGALVGRVSRPLWLLQLRVWAEHQDSEKCNPRWWKDIYYIIEAGEEGAWDYSRKGNLARDAGLLLTFILMPLAVIAAILIVAYYVPDHQLDLVDHILLLLVLPAAYLGFAIIRRWYVFQVWYRNLPDGEETTEPAAMPGKKWYRRAGGWLLRLSLSAAMLILGGYALAGLSTALLEGVFNNALADSPYWREVYRAKTTRGIMYHDTEGCRSYFRDANQGWVIFSRMEALPVKKGNKNWEDVTLTLQTEDGGKTWKHVHIPAGQIIWVDNKVGWMCNIASRMSSLSDNPIGIWQTRDGGNNWQQKTKKISTEQLAVVSADEAWCLSNSENNNNLPSLHHTVDAGRTWQKVALPKPTEDWYLEIGEVAFADKQHGWILGKIVKWIFKTPGDEFPDYIERAIILRTDNGGKTFQWLDLPKLERSIFFDAPSGKKRRFVSTDLKHLSHFGVNELWVTSDAWAEYTAILHSRDGGRTWQKVRMKIKDATRIEDMAIVPTNAAGAKPQLWILGYRMQRPVVIVSDDKGQSWKTVAVGRRDNYSLLINQLYARDGNNVWITGFDFGPSGPFVMKYVPGK
jgi:photosystem II stability/assembly factor-like uncharacterized protein